MKFDNEDTVNGIHSLRLVMAVIAVIIVFLLWATSLPEFIESVIGLGQDWQILTIVALYALFFAYFIIKGTAYFSYNDEGGRIIIRYFMLRVFNSPKLSIEIEKKHFYKYTIERKGLKTLLHLYVRRGKQISKYPPLSISSLTADRYRMLVDALNRHAEVKE